MMMRSILLRPAAGFLALGVQQQIIIRLCIAASCRSSSASSSCCTAATSAAAAAAAAVARTARTTHTTGCFVVAGSSNRHRQRRNISRGCCRRRKQQHRHRQGRQEQLLPSAALHAPSSFSSSMTAAAAASTTTTTDEDVKLMQDILYRVRDTNHMPPEIETKLIEFRVAVDGEKLLLGKTLPSTAELLCKNGAGVFVMSTDADGTKKYLTLSEGAAGSDCESRTEAVGRAMESLRDDGLVPGWRDELLPVTSGFYEQPVFLIERAAASLLATTEYGVHINGVVHLGDDDDGSDNNDETGNNDIRIWIGRRSSTKSKYPGMLDHVVAGGQPSGISLKDNVIKECMEEAGIPPDIVKQGLKPAGAVSYETYNGPNANTGIETITRSVLFCYDLILPNGFQPKPVDGEVDEFFQLSVSDILETMMDPAYPDPIKPNCYLVVIDFLIRHGYLNPDVPGYLDVLRELRSGTCR